MNTALKLAPLRDKLFKIVNYTPEGARLAQYTDKGQVIKLCLLCDNAYEGFEWMRENIQTQGIAVFGENIK